MANTPVQVDFLPSGMTDIILRLFPRASWDSLANTADEGAEDLGDELVEGEENLGSYRAVVTESLNGEYFAKVTDLDLNPLGNGYVEMVDGTEVCLVKEIPDAAIYLARIQLTRDNANTRDEWTVTWFKNGVPITSGITSPTIQLVKRADGSDLVAAAAMTQIGASGKYKYDEATNRITVGEAVVAIASATIDGATRRFDDLIGRDHA